MCVTSLCTRGALDTWSRGRSTAALADMRHVATLHYTEELVRSAVVSFWRRSVSWKLIVAIVVCVAGFAFLLLTGDRSWSIGVLGTVVFVAALLVAMIYVVHLRQSLQKLRALETPVATFAAE